MIIHNSIANHRDQKYTAKLSMHNIYHQSKDYNQLLMSSHNLNQKSLSDMLTLIHYLKDNSNQVSKSMVLWYTRNKHILLDKYRSQLVLFLLFRI